MRVVGRLPDFRPSAYRSLLIFHAGTHAFSSFGICRRRLPGPMLLARLGLRIVVALA